MPRRVLAIGCILVLLLGAAPARAFWFFGAQETPVPTASPETTDAVPASAGVPLPEITGLPAPTELPESARATATPEITPTATPEITPTATPDATPETLPSVSTDESATVRVKLESLGSVQALGLTLCGNYAVSNDPGFRFDRDTELSIAASGESLYMAVGGLTIDMGGSILLTRHKSDAGEANGILIHETNRENLYCGDLSLTNENGAITAILSIDVEEYLYGVLPYEMSDSFPIEALKAQAVAARTYVMSRRSVSRAYDVVDTPTSQVFRGYNPDCENSIRAVDATRGVVARYKDDYAACYFSASNGGQTALPDQIWGGAGEWGYLDVRDDPYDLENPSSVVKTYTIDADGEKLDQALKAVLVPQLTEQMAAIGYSDETRDIRILRVVSAEPVDAKFGAGNRMYTALRLGLTVEGKRVYSAYPTPNPQTTPANTIETVARTLYAAIPFYDLLKTRYGLKINTSDWEILSVTPMLAGEEAWDGETPDAFRLESRRFGHGIGLSQRGAQQMAGEYAMTYMQILRFYYPNAAFETRAYRETTLTALSELPESIGYARPRPTPKPTPAPLPALQSSERYATVALGSKSSTLNVRLAPGTDAKVVATLDHAQRLIVLDESDGWAHVKTAEVEGYVSAEFITVE